MNRSERILVGLLSGMLVGALIGPPIGIAIAYHQIDNEPGGYFDSVSTPVTPDPVAGYVPVLDDPTFLTLDDMIASCYYPHIPDRQYGHCFREIDIEEMTSLPPSATDLADWYPYEGSCVASTRRHGQTLDQCAAKAWAKAGAA